jgi:hypothetical protein
MKPPSPHPRPLAPHVQTALRTVQPKAAPQASGPAAHVAAAIQACKLPGPAAGGRNPVPHVQAAIQAKPAPQLPPRPGERVQILPPPVAQKASAGQGAFVIQRALNTGLGEEGVQQLLEIWLLKYKKSKKTQSEIKSEILFKFKTVPEYDPTTDDPIIRRLLFEAFSEPQINQDQVEQIELIFQTSDDHLTKFEKGIIRVDSSANQVNVQLRIDGSVKAALAGKESESLSDQTIDNEMRCPRGSADPVVVNTQNDGEVPKLSNALKIISRHFSKLSGNKSCSFDVSLYGAWGACDGCKQRIERFAELWYAEAKSVMKSGKTAILTITYQYLNPPTVMTPVYGDNRYGWEEDPGKGTWNHSLKASVTGT